MLVLHLFCSSVSTGKFAKTNQLNQLASLKELLEILYRSFAHFEDVAFGLFAGNLFDETQVGSAGELNHVVNVLLQSGGRKEILLGKELEHYAPQSPNVSWASLLKQIQKHFRSTVSQPFR